MNTWIEFNESTKYMEAIVHHSNLAEGNVRIIALKNLGGSPEIMRRHIVKKSMMQRHIMKKADVIKDYLDSCKCIVSIEDLPIEDLHI